ncbi:ABC transporter permease [Allokutzneria sp. A3M-2-11 16]|uniref:ABC transporter permease n=1 Tax=Allokutzneria sp. A3M-2-11 16 TaxID=2962043 RepID=UPI0020B86C23|nr:ABC transporter permease [Allokutzneria sp. A3M-2-11 16]MCP3804877.1 ABC transporter permease [Allokutzneria sp. A3M-2-11 16]
MRPLFALTRVEVALFLREPAAVLFTLALPLLLLFLNGSNGNQPREFFGGAGVVDVVVAGYLVYVMTTSGVLGMAETLADYRDKGILRRMRVSPLRPWQILGSHALTNLLMSVLGAALLVVVASAFFGLSRPASIPLVLLVLAAAACCVLALGFLLGAMLPTVRMTQAVSSALYFPSIFISGALFPRESLPEFAQRLSDVLPVTYAVNAIRAAWAHGVLDGTALIVLLGTAVVGTAVALRAFRWESR